jgi:hypothetical protein
MLIGALTLGLLLALAAGPNSLTVRLWAGPGEDEYDDLAIGVPWDQIQSYRPGTVAVFYGSSYPSLSGANHLWTQNASGTLHGAEDGDQFGRALAAGDFDGDDYYDLAIGVPEEDFSAPWSYGSAGAVSVLYGAASGISSRSQIFYQNLLTDAATGDRYGSALAAGDFDGNGCDDLAMGVPHEDIGAWPGNNGLVNVVYGTTGGFGSGGPPDQMWWQGGANVSGSPSENDRFGWALVAIPSDYRVYLPLIQRDPS